MITHQGKQKLKEKLAKWVGWHEEKYEIEAGSFAPILLAPNEQLIEGRVGYISEHTPNFPDSLDDCLEWIWPKLLQEHALVEVYTSRQANGSYYVEVCIWDRGEISLGVGVLKGRLAAKHYEQGFNLKVVTALALCLATKKLIDGET